MLRIGPVVLVVQVESRGVQTLLRIANVPDNFVRHKVFAAVAAGHSVEERTAVPGVASGT